MPQKTKTPKKPKPTTPDHIERRIERYRVEACRGGEIPYEKLGEEMVCVVGERMGE